MLELIFKFKRIGKKYDEVLFVSLFSYLARLDQKFFAQIKSCYNCKKFCICHYDKQTLFLAAFFQAFHIYHCSTRKTDNFFCTFLIEIKKYDIISASESNTHQQFIVYYRLNCQVSTHHVYATVLLMSTKSKKELFC